MHPSSSKAGALVLVGNPGVEHVGHHLSEAACAIDLPLHFCDSTSAYNASPLIRRFNWWVRGRRPSHLGGFSRLVREACEEAHPKALLTTGISPVDEETLQAIGRTGVCRMNFLTDDPWNPAHQAPWFLRALRSYDVVFSPREANMDDLRRHGCADVRYLPFAWSPRVHFRETSAAALPAADVFFAGGADAERVPYIAALIEAGIGVALYGGYWGRYSATRKFDRGHASVETVRKAVTSAKLSLCLVRRANRDGHAMRTFELAAMGACMLAEDTAEHRAILGPEGISAAYFRTIPEMIEKARALLEDEDRSRAMGEAVRSRICGSPNTWSDRLHTMLEAARNSRRAPGLAHAS